MLYLGVIGYPIKHSVSPAMHRAAMAELGLDGTYLAFEVEPTNLHQAVVGARALGFKGLNVTIPYKEEVLKFTKPEGYAARIGAANTIKLEDMTSYNTDVFGAVKAVEVAGVDVKGKTALVVGAGGAGKAVALALLELGAKVIITNRTATRGLEAVEVLRKYGECTFHPYEKVADLRWKIDLIANATPLGMKGFAANLPVPEDVIEGVSAVFDTVYNPLETPLVKAAKKRGCGIIQGLDMLVYQGAKAFEIWTGLEAPVDVMKKAAISALKTSEF